MESPPGMVGFHRIESLMLVQRPSISMTRWKKVASFFGAPGVPYPLEPKLAQADMEVSA